jgi:hypothetical protein
MLRHVITVEGRLEDVTPYIRGRKVCKVGNVTAGAGLKNIASLDKSFTRSNENGDSGEFTMMEKLETIYGRGMESVTRHTSVPEVTLNKTARDSYPTLEAIRRAKLGDEYLKAKMYIIDDVLPNELHSAEDVTLLPKNRSRTFWKLEILAALTNASKADDNMTDEKLADDIRKRYRRRVWREPSLFVQTAFPLSEEPEPLPTIVQDRTTTLLRKTTMTQVRQCREDLQTRRILPSNHA